MPESVPQSQQEHKRRTMGNRVFDLLVYPSIAFGTVFAFSIWALHATKYGSGRAHDFFTRTNEKLAQGLGRLPVFSGMSPQKRAKEAGNYASILVSFATGTLLISPITWFESKREHIAEAIDKVLGTTPKDPNHYAREPKQNWKSIFGGRAITFASVLALGTAIGEERTTRITGTAVAGVENLWKKARPNANAATLKKVREWTDVSAFETFYTALCAVLVYAISRGLARLMDKREDKNTPLAAAAPAAVPETQEEAQSRWRENARREGHLNRGETYVEMVGNSLPLNGNLAFSHR